MGDGGECKVNPEYNELRHHRKHALRRFLIVTGAFVLIALLLLGLTAFIVWLVLRPIHSPSWEVDDVKLITINIQSTKTRRRLQSYEELTSNNGLTRSSNGYSDWGLTTYLVNADMVVTLKASNRNHHMEVTYDRVDMRVAYATEVVGKAMVVPFTQGKRSESFVGAELKAMSVPVTFIVANALQAEIQTGCVGLQVFVDVRARVRIGTYRSFGFGVKTACDVSLTTPENSRAGQLITKKCHRY